MNEKLVITAALSGAETIKKQNPAIPYEPEEFAEEAYRCLEAGASIVHIHAKDPETGIGVMDVQRHRDTVAAIRERCPEMIINISTGHLTASNKERVAPVVDVKPELASLNTSTMNWANVNYKTGEVLDEVIYKNTFEAMQSLAENMMESNVKPELEIFDPGGLYGVLLVDKKKGLFAQPLHFQFVYGVAGGMPFDPALHLSLVGLLAPGTTYSVCGVGPNQTKAAMMSAISGGHIRIGLEDNLKMPNGDLAKGSWEQIQWVKEVTRLAGRQVATPDEARKIFNLRKRDL